MKLNNIFYFANRIINIYNPHILKLLYSLYYRNNLKNLQIYNLENSKSLIKIDFQFSQICIKNIIKFFDADVCRNDNNYNKCINLSF